MVVNPGAWTHYSYAIRDAVELFTVPVVEVHLSNILEREEWRRPSVIEDVVAHRIMGMGPDGYREALDWLAGASGDEPHRPSPRPACPTAAPHSSSRAASTSAT